MKKEINENIATLQQSFLGIMKDFEIRSDIKEDFAEFSAGCLSDLSNKLDEFFANLKKDLFERMAKKLLSY